MKQKKMLINFILSLCLSTAALGSAKVYADTISSKRISGADRYETSIEISKNGWTTSDNAIIATGEDFPDALCASPLAKKLNAPILLTKKEALEDNLSNEIKSLKVKNVYIIGGQGVVSQKVQDSIENLGLGINVKRISGNNRYETSIAIAKELGSFQDIALATGENFPDALSIAPIAAKKGMPIILTQKNFLPQEASNFVNGKNIQNTFVIGATSVIGDYVYSCFKNVERLSGNNRYNTNSKVIQNFSSELDFTSVYVATGEAFPDALSGSILAAKNSSPVILTDSSIEENLIPYISSDVLNIKNIISLGGTGAIPEQTISNLSSMIAREASSVDETDKAVVIRSEEDFYNAAKDALFNCKDFVRIKSINPEIVDNYIDILSKVLNDYADYADYIHSCSASSDSFSFSYNEGADKNTILAQISASDEKAQEIIQKIITPNMTELQKEKAIHDYVVRNTDYDYYNYTKGTIPYISHTAYGTLIKKVAVCDGYAKTMLKLLRLAGIECYYVTGEASGEGHSWNIVKINDKYYHVDATYDDPVVIGGNPTLKHTYFNVNDDFMSKDHSWDKSMYPACE